MVTIILLRHGNTEYNVLKKFTGQKDIPLTDLGKREAQIAADFLFAHYKISSIYSSDLSRAVETALPTAKQCGLAIQKDKRFREFDLGAWTDMEIEEVLRKYPTEYAAYRNGAKSVGGESRLDVQKRAMDALKEIVTGEDGQTVLIVSHGGTIRMILQYVLAQQGKVLGSLTVSNCAISELTYENGQFSIVSISQNQHLTKAG